MSSAEQQLLAKPEPSAPGSERVLLSLAMASPDLRVRVFRELDKSMFYVPGNKVLFCVLKDLCESGDHDRRQPDAITADAILSAAKYQKYVRAMGGEDFLRLMAEGMPLETKNFDYHLNMVVVRAAQREKIRVANKILDDVMKYDGEVLDDVLSLGDRDLADIMATHGRSRKTAPVRIGDHLVDTLTRIHRKDASVQGVYTGLYHLDERFMGLVPGRLYVIVARPAVGKSSFLIHLASSIGVIGVPENGGPLPVGVIDTETENDDYQVRLLANVAGMPNDIIYKDEFRQSTEGKAAIRDSVVHIVKNSKVYWCRHQFMTFEMAAREIRDLVRRKQIRVVLYDQIKIPELGHDQKEYQAIGAMVTKLKDLAEELCVPILAVAHTNREDTASMIREAAKGHSVDPSRCVADSDRIFRYASVVMHMRRMTSQELDVNGGFENGNVMITAFKNRHGLEHQFLEGFIFKFYKSCHRFESMAEKALVLNQEESDNASLF